MKRRGSPYTYEAGPQGPALASDLLHWYATNQRDLPWRRSRDPYRIWVSEVMLQQTRVDTVIPYYERWLDLFPTPEHLAAAPEEQVLKAWEGLGYYSRARNLHQAAQEVVSRYGGELPDDPQAISHLKGVGPYTAGAILSIAYNRSVPAVDGNVMRVLSRLYLIEEDIAQPATRKAMEGLAQALIPPGEASAFNQALMELGALICTPRSPKCLLCPVRAHCQALEAARVEELPRKGKAKAPRPVEMVTMVLWHQGRLLISRRPSEGLLAGLWEFPSGERPADLSPEQAIHQLAGERFGAEVEVEAHLTDVKHVFTHLVWNLKAYTAHLAPGQEIDGSEALRWVSIDELDQLPFPVAQQRVIEALEVIAKS